MSRTRPTIGRTDEHEPAPSRDAELVRQVLAGRPEAFGGLMERYRREFGRYAVSLCGDGDLAADAMQEAFIRAFDSLDRCEQPERFGAWFFRILTNQCHNHRNRTRRHESLDDLAVAGRDDADRDVTTSELREAIGRALGLLSPDLRETFVLREVEGRSYAEVSRLLNVSEAALRKRVERAREVVRAALEEWI